MKISLPLFLARLGDPTLASAPVKGPLAPLVAALPRLGDAVVNGLEVLALGGLAVDDQPAPFDVPERGPNHRLRHYFPETDGPARPAAILVPPLMLTAEVYDVSERTSAATILHRLGVDPWVVDFGDPVQEEGGRRRTLSDHVLAVDQAVDQVVAATGRPVHLCGYSQGGMFCYQAAAYRRCADLTSLVTFGSPVDPTAVDPMGIPSELLSRLAASVVGVAGGVGVPAWASRTGFRLLDPVKSVRAQVEFLAQLHDRDRLAERERQRRFLARDGWVAWSGPAFAEALEQFVVHNRLAEGGFVIGDRLVSLADIDRPVFAVVGETDEIAAAPVVRAVAWAAPNADVFEMAVPAGHFGLVVGSYAAANTWPTVAQWLHWQDGSGEQPTAIRPIGAEDAQPQPSRRSATVAGLAYAANLASELGTGSARTMMNGLSRAAHSMRTVSTEAVTQLPRLARLEQIRAGTVVSFGALLDEQAGHAPGAPCFLSDDRSHSRADTKHRIDSVVRGLISIGVRQGEPVGVLMTTRPSAFVAVAALNRLGAVAVLLRPDGDTTREVAVGAATRVLADPEHAAAALSAVQVPVAVLGAAGRPDTLPPGAFDLERVDPDSVTLPRWYRANPGRARDLAFVLFSGEGEATRARHISNHRWALSAFGTASSAAITAADTVYATTPLHHPSGLLTAVGGAVAGGARLALSRDFSPAVFWEEVRRYGATVVSYTWSLLREIVDADADWREQHHPIRLFIGSGMPRGLWQRVDARLGPARVVEFYAPIDGEAVLANVATNKPGAMGRPLPGGADLRVAAYDVATGHFEISANGLVRQAEPGEIGMLLVAVHPAEAVADAPLRGVFTGGDSWRPTGDLFWRDAQGDHWLAGRAAQVVTTLAGPLYPALVDDALGSLPGVDLAVTYPIDLRSHGITVSAVSVLPGHQLSADDLNAVLAGHPQTVGPDVVRVVDAIPITAWYRPHAGGLAAEGLGPEEAPAWRRTEQGSFVPIEPGDRHLLAGSAS
jgi:putative long chain acyl-CoA synthase